MNATDHRQVLRETAGTGATAATVARNWLVRVNCVGDLHSDAAGIVETP